MYCIKCGNEIPEGLDSCPNCDTVINNTVDNIPNEEIKVEVKEESQEEIHKENVVLNEEVVQKTQNSSYLPYDVPSNPVAALGVILPPIGLIYYFVTRKDTPVKAKSALKGFFVGVVVYILAALIFKFLLLPYVERIGLKILCENNEGAVYNYETNICKHADGTEIQMLLK